MLMVCGRIDRPFEAQSSIWSQCRSHPYTVRPSFWMLIESTCQVIPPSVVSNPLEVALSRYRVWAKSLSASFKTMVMLDQSWDLGREWVLCVSIDIFKQEEDIELYSGFKWTYRMQPEYRNRHRSIHYRSRRLRVSYPPLEISILVPDSILILYYDSSSSFWKLTISLLRDELSIHPDLLDDLGGGTVERDLEVKGGIGWNRNICLLVLAL